MNTLPHQQLPPALQQTPWGPAQHGKEIAPGIWSVDTAGHGGFYLHEIRLKQLHPAWKGFVGYSGSYQWFEEDCDWAIVALCFPDHFSDYLVYEAFKVVATLDYARERLLSFLTSADGKILFESSIKFEADNGHLFSIGSLSSSGQGWDCSAYRIDGQERLTWHQDDYPQYKHPFHRTQLARYEVKSEPRPAPAVRFADLPLTPVTTQ